MVDSAQRSPGERLRELRVLAGLSARELGRLAGVAPNTITNIERGDTPSPAKAAAIIGALVACVQRAHQPIDHAQAEIARLRSELSGAETRLVHEQRRHGLLIEALDAAGNLWPAPDEDGVAA